MVGAYDWDGGVLKEGLNGRIMPPREAFESEFPLELKNHAAYLGDCNQNLRETNKVAFTVSSECWAGFSFIMKGFIIRSSLGQLLKTCHTAWRISVLGNQEFPAGTNSPEILQMSYAT